MIEALKFKTGYVTTTTHLSGTFVNRRLELAMVNMCTKFEVSISTSYEDENDDAKRRNWWLGVIRGHSRSLEIAPFDRDLRVPISLPVTTTTACPRKNARLSIML